MQRHTAIAVVQRAVQPLQFALRLLGCGSLLERLVDFVVEQWCRLLQQELLPRSSKFKLTHFIFIPECHLTVAQPQLKGLVIILIELVLKLHVFLHVWRQVYSVCFQDVLNIVFIQFYVIVLLELLHALHGVLDFLCAQWCVLDLRICSVLQLANATWRFKAWMPFRCFSILKMAAYLHHVSIVQLGSFVALHALG